MRLVDGYPSDIHLFTQGIKVAGSTAVSTVGTVVSVLVTLPRRDDDGSPRDLARLTCDVIAPPLPPPPPTVPPAPPAPPRPVVRVDFAAALNDPSNPTLPYVRLTFSVPATNPVVGETYCRVKYVAAGGTTLLTNLIFRVSVHTSLTNFWLGNRRITLFNNIGVVDVPRSGLPPITRYTNIDSSDVTVYATCDNAGANSLANLTGHSYLDLLYTPGAHANAGGVKVGLDKLVTLKTAATFTSITPVRLGSLAVTIGGRAVATTGGAAATVPVYGVAAVTVSRPLLRRFHCGTDQDTTRRFKILFLTEGFTSQGAVTNWLTFIGAQLLDHPMHEPFGTLRESLELWTADWLSYDTQEGITQKSPLNAQGYWVPAHPLQFAPHPTTGVMTAIDDDARSATLLSMRELIKLVGLPSLSSPTTLTDATTTWGSLLTPTGKTVDQDLFDVWKAQTPNTFIYAKDTVFGLAKGTAPRRESSSSLLSWGDWALENEVNVPSIMDWNYARQGEAQNTKVRLEEILRSLTTGPGVPAADRINGRNWLDNSGNEHSAGLVVILTNDPTVGGVSMSIDGLYYGSMFSAGGDQRYVTTPAAPTPALPLADVNPVLAPAIAAGAVGAARYAGPASVIGGIATAVHEMGHLLGLGDEYGNVYGRPHGNTCSPAGDPGVDRFPNIVTLARLQAAVPAVPAAPPAPAVPAAPPAVTTVGGQRLVTAPEQVKWNWDRTALAGRLRTDPVLVGAPAATAATAVLRLRLDFDPTQNWAALLPAPVVPPATPPVPAPPPVRVILRARKLVDSTTGVLNTTVLYPLTLRAAVAHPPVPATTTTPLVPGYYEVEVEGALPLVTVAGAVAFKAIKVDDVLYAPRFYPVDSTTGAGGQKMRLIAQEVAGALGTTSFKVTAPVNCATASMEQQWPLDAFVQAMNRDLGKQAITGVVSTADPSAPAYARPATAPAAATPAPTPTLHSFNIIAIYEGGGEYDCQAYRSNGYSKMRSASIDHTALHTVTVNPFNYVSKYFLINKINPTKLAALDALYATEAY